MVYGSKLVRTFFRLTLCRLSCLVVFLLLLKTLTLAVINVQTPKLVMVRSQVRIQPLLANRANYYVLVVLVQMHRALVVVLSSVLCAENFSTASALEGKEVFLVAKVGRTELTNFIELHYVLKSID